MNARRRVVLMVAAAMSPFAAALAQPKGVTRRIGYLAPTTSADVATLQAQLADALKAIGFRDGQSLVFVSRAAQDDVSRLPALARELVEADVSVIVAAGPEAIVAAHAATRTIPIVMAYWGGEGLVKAGRVASLAHPGGNVTGVQILSDELDGKRLEFLLATIPTAKRVAVLSPMQPGDPFLSAEVRNVAANARVELVAVPATDSNAYGVAFATMRRQRIDAVLVPSFPRFWFDRTRIIEAAAAARLPAMYEWGDMARAGGLVAYGPVIGALQRRVAWYVDRILQGSRAGDLPIEQPDTFELVINRRTANALHVAIPPAVLARADEVVE